MVLKISVKFVGSTCFVFIALMLFYALMINTIPSLFLQSEFCLLVGSFLMFMLSLTSIKSLNIFDNPSRRAPPPTHLLFFFGSSYSLEWS